MKKSLSKLCWVGLVALVMNAGCGEAVKPPKLPDTVPFKGVVKLDGKPMNGGVITFSPAKDITHTGSSVISANGEYDLKISVGKITKNGVKPGEYKVTVSRFLDPSGNPQDPTKKVEVPGMESLPMHYTNPVTTPLTATVPAAGGSQDFELKSK